MSWEELREEVETRDFRMPIIMVSAGDDPGTRQKGHQIGAVGFFRKPVDGGSCRMWRRIGTSLLGVTSAEVYGTASFYKVFKLEPRGNLFVRPGDPVYEGMIVGEHSRDNDLNVNPCKTKKLIREKLGLEAKFICFCVRRITYKNGIDTFLKTVNEY